MTSRKQDKPALTEEEALSEIDLNAGIMFDPALVRIFARVVRQGTVLHG